jgi:hypothetical protein
MNKDRRRINQVWVASNREGLFFVFAKIGSGKNSYTKTIGFRKTKVAAENLAKKTRRSQ